MKIKLNDCPKCGGAVEFDDLTFFGFKHFCGRCPACNLRGEYGRNKTLAAEKWNSGNIQFNEHEVERRLIQMCQNEIERTDIKSEVDNMYITKLNEMIRYYKRW